MAAESAGEVSGPVAMMTLVPLRRRQARDLAALDGDERVRLELPRHVGGEAVAVDRQRAAGGQLVAVAGGHDERAGAPHLLVQQADGVAGGIVGAEAVGADQLGEVAGLVRLGLALGPHLVQDHGHAEARDLPRRLGPGQPAADDVDGRVGHSRNVCRLNPRINPAV